MVKKRQRRRYHLMKTLRVFAELYNNKMAHQNLNKIKLKIYFLLRPSANPVEHIAYSGAIVSFDANFVESTKKKRIISNLINSFRKKIF